MKRILPLVLAVTLLAVALAVAPADIPFATGFRFFGPMPLTSSSHGANPLAALPTVLLPTLRNLTTFPSEAAVGGHASWHPSLPTNSSHPAVVSAHFGDADTPFEAYALTELTIPSGRPPRVALQCNVPLSIHPANNDPPQHCSPQYDDSPLSICILRLPPGQYSALVHLASSSSTASFTCAHFLSPTVDPPSLLSLGHAVFPSVVVEPSHPVNHSRLAGPYLSFTVQNLRDDAWAIQPSITLLNPPPGIRIVSHKKSNLAPLQSATVQVVLKTDSRFLAPTHPYDVPEPRVVTLSLAATFRIASATVTVVSNVSLPVVDWPARAYVFTFRDTDGSAQASAVVPPTRGCSRCPPLLSTHGAGVDATARAWTESYRPQNGSWVILPTGRRRFGLNWHGPQLLSAVAALQAFERDMPGVPPKLADAWRPSKDAWLAAGHSMGGHGALVLATHFPDMLVAALPAMAWLRLDQFGAETLGEDATFSDASLRALLAVSSAEYNTDMYVGNLLGIPFLARVGSADDNVPPTNLRKFVRLLKENEMYHNVSSVVGLSEIPGKGHWFDGVVDDDVLQKFFDKYLHPGHGKPRLPRKFSMFTMNPASSSSRGGLRILQQDVPFESSKLRVTRDVQKPGAWLIQTENVRRFRYQPVRGVQDRPTELLFELDKRGYSIDASGLASWNQHVDFCAQAAGHWGGLPKAGQPVLNWRRCKDSGIYGTERSSIRAPDTFGPAFRVLSGRKVVVVFPAKDRALRDLGVRYSNILFRHGLDVSLAADNVAPEAGDGTNLVILGGPKMNRVAKKYGRGYSADVKLREDGSFCVGTVRCFAGSGMGMMFLAGGPKRSLLLFVIGTDEDGMSATEEFLPYTPASGLPEWVVVSGRRGFGFRGLGGVVGVGYWDEKWGLEARKTYPGDFVGAGLDGSKVCAVGATGGETKENLFVVMMVVGLMGGVIVLYSGVKRRYARVGEDEITTLVHGGGKEAVVAKRVLKKGLEGERLMEVEDGEDEGNNIEVE